MSSSGVSLIVIEMIAIQQPLSLFGHSLQRRFSSVFTRRSTRRRSSARLFANRSLHSAFRQSVLQKYLL
jgi:hypothetical protein